ncbi:MAG: hypothetical protein R3Y57_04725, partial [Erysipelotrichaceae bacterium]
LNSVSAERKLQLQLQAEEDAVREYVSQTNAIERKALEKGRGEGKSEGIIETAKNLKGLNAPIEMIMEATGLSFEEVEKL